MGRLFGTDGVRGLANADLSADLALRLAAAAVQVLGAHGGTARPVVVVGRDPRPSGELLEAAVAAGLASAGAEVELLGVVPTPAVAYATAQDGVDLGVMITASHNAMPDNGIKFFARGGQKLPDAVEDEIEAHVAAQESGDAGRRPTGAEVGRIRRRNRHRDTAYADHLLSTVRAPLTGLRVVVDCAEGAAVPLAPGVYRAAGADVVPLHATGDGRRINDGCGATHLESLQAAVLEHGADLGIAHDGDADRCLAVDGTGAVVDGDQILGVLALALQERGALPTGTVVATVMSNLGLHHALRDAGIGLVTTPVGDRYVLEAMRRDGHRLGGEQSGHLVLLEHATTGDGLLTALQLMARVAETGRSLADLASVVRRLPQVLINVRAERARAEAPDVLDAVGAAQARLGETGRVLLRPSGTEPLVRVMVEAATEDEAADVARGLAEVVGRG